MINWTNVSSLSQLPGLANDASAGTFWTATVFMIWMILILVMIGFGFEIALLAATFAALLIAIAMLFAGIVAFYVPLFFMAMLLILFLYITYSHNKR